MQSPIDAPPQSTQMKPVNRPSSPSFNITPSGQACGATLTGLNLRTPLSAETIQALRKAWLTHHVLTFPDQELAPEDLERVSTYFGKLRQDPFIKPLAGHKHIIPVRRRARETGPIFADSWHSDWSFQDTPPIGTCLYAITIPPTGGDTLFANQHTALDAMPDELRNRITGLRAIHSGEHAYAPTGTYSKMDKIHAGMTIETSTHAHARVTHPFILNHSETGRPALFGTSGHLIGFEGMDEIESKALLGQLYRWQTRPEFQYRHKWQPNMLVIWDNRCLIHMATGGYAGHERLLHRTTLSAS